MPAPTILVADEDRDVATRRSLRVNRAARWALPGILIVSMLAGCTPPEERPAGFATAYRQVGTWSGAGNKTIGDVRLASGRFRVTWQTTGEAPPGAGRFVLTARSSVSGRPLQEVADHLGEGGGTIEFGEEDRRIYDFTVESANVQWSFTVDDVITVPK